MSYYARDPGDTPEAPCYCGGQAPGPVLTTAEHCPACGDPDAPVAEPESHEYERSGWYCPMCEKETPHTLCDGCKSLICGECGYPCACGERHDADHPERED